MTAASSEVGTNTTGDGPAAESELVALRRRLQEYEILLGKLTARQAKLEQQLDSAWAQVAWLQRQVFGRKAEGVPSEDLAAAFRAYVAQQENEAKAGRSASPPLGPTPTPLSYQLLLGFLAPEDFVPEEDGDGPDQASPADAPREIPAEPPAAESRPDGEPARAVDTGSSGPGPAKTRGHGRRDLSKTPPVITIRLEPEELPQTPAGEARFVGAEVSYRLAFQRAQFVQLAVVRNSYAIDQEDGSTKVLTAEPPAEMIPRGLFSPSGLAHLVSMKWDRSVPYNRLSRFFEDENDFPFSRSTLSGTVVRAEPLARDLVKALAEYARVHAKTLGIDASGARILEPGQNPRGYVWVRYVDNIAALVDFTPKHNAETVRTLLEGWSCPTVADGASVFDSVVDDQRRGGCHSHGRRRLVYAAPNDSRALVGVRYINQLFDIERDSKDLSDDERLQVRLLRSKPVLAELFAWRDRLLKDPSLSDRSLLAKALRYLKNQERRLSFFLTNGAIRIHNNDTELQIRHYAVGRRNWLFHGSARAAKAAGTWLTLVLTARMHRLPVEPYLRDLFRVLPVWPRPRILELAPHAWKDTRARLNTGQLASEFGPIDIPPPLDPAHASVEPAQAPVHPAQAPVHQ